MKRNIFEKIIAKFLIPGMQVRAEAQENYKEMLYAQEEDKVKLLFLIEI
ncbi:MAG: hypothetical protein MOIL_00661 [Candidatus Methanolliviera sp. GoM_oil]|nr:MAG: hypothetical protein MOIL_00661 [Candidatus Methanolliviera sp. GoM_oil]